MALVPYGTPVRYRDNSGNIYGGIVVSDNGVNPRIAYYNSGWTVTSPLATRDDTGATNDSYAIVQLDGGAPKFQGT